MKSLLLSLIWGIIVQGVDFSFKPAVEAINDLPVDLYLDWMSITFVDLNHLAKSNPFTIKFNENLPIRPETKLVRVGFHGTGYKAAKLMAETGIKPSSVGTFGPGVYASNDILTAGFYASWNFLNRYPGDFNRDPKQEYICHLFVTTNDFHKMNLFRVPFGRKGDCCSISNTDNAVFVLEHQETTIIGPALAPKLIPFCEVFAEHTSLETHQQTRPNSILDFHNIFKKETAEYAVNSVFRGKMPVVDFTIAGQLSGWKGHLTLHRQISSCSFCLKPEVARSDDDIIIFPDIAPKGRFHMLVIPQSHDLKSIFSLTKSHIGLVKRMKQKCIDSLRANGFKEYTEGVEMFFHIPPYTSVDHLHLHCMVDRTFADRIMFGKHFTHKYILIDELIRRLERDIDLTDQELKDSSFISRAVAKVHYHRNFNKARQEYMYGADNEKHLWRKWFAENMPF